MYVLRIITKKNVFIFFLIAEGWIFKQDQKLSIILSNRPNEQDAGQGLPAHGADVATRQKQNGVHSHRFGCPPSHPLQCAPTSRVQVQPGPGEHASRCRFAPGGEVPDLILTVH